METQQSEPALVRPVLGPGQGQHRCLADVQRVVARIVMPAQLLQHGPASGIRHPLLHRQPSLAPDHLHRLLEHFPDQAGAQDVVPGNHRLQGLGEGLKLCPMGKGERCVLLIGIARGVGHVVVEQPCLQRRQGVDFLHIGGASGDAGHHPVDAVLIQLHQRQHRRGDPLAAGGTRLAGISSAG